MKSIFGEILAQMLGKVNFEYENLVRKIEPEDRNDYFEWAYENHVMDGTEVCLSG